MNGKINKIYIDEHREVQAISSSRTKEQKKNFIMP